ncbi:hypothetical protein I5I61_18700 [Pseudomonas nitroreducens]|uniref:Uncharacterized protein n=1 Tax=Pseudomonas nitroreducens TaxID=46680 RepID=A0ABS0KNE2_PSENT|nr:hypothetical protein [Pseudomonas nitroreducens]MBG6289488.1 hypothetical protein [Pseudomonas nitroreducens]
MLVTVDPFMPLNNKAARQHPWTTTMHAENAGAYYDFIKNPEQIREKLEDFKPHESQKAVQFFYWMLEMINRKDGPLETCDCALSSIISGPSLFGKPQQIRGRLEVIARDRSVNTDLEAMSNLIRNLTICLQDEWTDCDVVWLEIHCLKTQFMDMPVGQSAGYRTSIFFEVNGDSGDEIWRDLYYTFVSIDHALTKIEGIVS